MCLEVEWQRILPQIFSQNLYVVLGKAVNAENVYIYWGKNIVMWYTGKALLQSWLHVSGLLKMFDLYFFNCK